MLTSPNEQTLRKLRALCLSLPETNETASWGHPNFKAGKTTFVAFERVKGRASIAFRLERDEVKRLLQRKQFFETPYGRGLWASVWADGQIDWPTVQKLVNRSYRGVCQVKGQRAKAQGKGQRDKAKGQRGKAKGQRGKAKGQRGKAKGQSQRYEDKVRVKVPGE